MNKRAIASILRGLPKLFPAFGLWVNILPWALLSLTGLVTWLMVSVLTLVGISTLVTWVIGFYVAALMLVVSYAIVKVAVRCCVTFTKPPPGAALPAGVVYVSFCEDCCQELGCLACFLLGCGCAMC